MSYQVNKDRRMQMLAMNWVKSRYKSFTDDQLENEYYFLSTYIGHKNSMYSSTSAMWRREYLSELETEMIERHLLGKESSDEGR